MPPNDVVHSFIVCVHHLGTNKFRSVEIRCRKWVHSMNIIPNICPSCCIIPNDSCKRCCFSCPPHNVSKKEISQATSKTQAMISVMLTNNQIYSMNIIHGHDLYQRIWRVINDVTHLFSLRFAIPV